MRTEIDGGRPRHRARIAPAAATRGTPAAIRAAGADDLDAINGVVASAVGTWRLPARVQRLALPSLLYSASDLAVMDVVVATDLDGRTVGVAATEAAVGAEVPDGLRALLLHGVYVAPERHRRGVGTMLVEHVSQVARSDGADGVLTRAWRDAERFFVARGFEPPAPPEPAGRYPRPLWRRLG